MSQPKFQPRRPFDDDTPEGLLESDQDFVLNNLEICVQYLEQIQLAHEMVDEIIEEEKDKW